MTDLKTQLEAILQGAAFAPLTGENARAFLRITGPDATRWLNGMVTNNIKDLAPGEGNYNFLLNAQGRIQGDCTIYREPDGTEPVFVLETDSTQMEALQPLLDKFIIMDDVELSLMDHWHNTLLVLGPKAHDVLRKMEKQTIENTYASLPPLRLAYDGRTAAQIATPGPGLVPQFEISTVDWNEALIAEAKTAGAVELSPEALEAYRILSATPRYGTDIRNTETAKDLPQETAQTHALHFSKGCYLGQEIVERIHSRGAVHRTFAQFTLSGPLPTLPAPLELNGKTVGELTSAAIIPLSTGDITLALGYARLEALPQPLTYPGGTATQRRPQHLKT